MTRDSTDERILCRQMKKNQLQRVVFDKTALSVELMNMAAISIK